MASVAIITARVGSKRIPRKNIKLFRGKPIIAYSIETALQSGLFDYVMVSTCLLYTSPSPRDRTRYRMLSSAWQKKNNKLLNHQ